MINFTDITNYFSDIINYLKELIFKKKDYKEDQYYEWKGNKELTLSHNLIVFENNIDYFIEYKKEYNEIYFKILKRTLPPLKIDINKRRLVYVEYQISGKQFITQSVLWYSTFINIIDTCLMKYIENDFDDHKLFLRKYNSDTITIIINISFLSDEKWGKENYTLFTDNIKANRLIKEKSRIIYQSYKLYLEKEDYYQIISVSSIVVKFV